MRRELAVVVAGSVLLACHDTPTTPNSRRFEAGPRIGATTSVGSFTLRDIGTLGGPSSDAYGINASGDVVGISSDSSGVHRPTLWPADGSAPRSLVNLSEHPMISSGTWANAINTAGDIVGVSYNSNGYQRATLWPRGGGAPRDLGALPGADYSVARAINDAGDVVGISRLNSGSTLATLWPGSGGPPRDLGPGEAYAINAAGTIAGVSPLFGATLWPAGGGAPQGLPGGGGAAYGINDAGDVVGATAFGDWDGAALWPADGSSPRYLGTLGGFSEASAINNAGQIVGRSTFAGDWLPRAVLYRTDGGDPHDLGTLGGAWSVAAGINSSGRIVGVSMNPENPQTGASDLRAIVWEPVQQPQSITFASTPPNEAIVGGTYTVSATGGDSGNPVTFTSLAPTVCSVAGNAVSFDAGGSCTIAADQAGGAWYGAAPQVTQSFEINTRPVASAGTAQSGNEGSTITFSAANSSDADGDALIAYTWDFGDGTVQTVTAPTVEHTYSDNNPGGGAYLVALQVTDAKGATSVVANTSARIDNIAPSATFNPVSPVGEGTLNLSLTGAQDAAGDVATLQHAFDCGDGNGYGAFSPSASITCTVPDDGVRAVRAKIKDKDGAISEYAKSVTVVNVAPSIVIISGPASGKVGTYYTLQYRFTDPGTLDAPWSVQTIWGDGRNPAAPSAVSAQGQTITQTYRYNKAGSYTTTVRVTDKNGGTAISSVPVLIVK